MNGFYLITMLYGTVMKSGFTGSAANVDGKVIAKSPEST